MPFAANTARTFTASHVKAGPPPWGTGAPSASLRFFQLLSAQVAAEGPARGRPRPRPCSRSPPPPAANRGVHAATPKPPDNCDLRSRRPDVAGSPTPPEFFLRTHAERRTLTSGRGRAEWRHGRARRPGVCVRACVRGCAHARG